MVASDSHEGHLPMDQGTEGRERLQRVMKQSLGNKGEVPECEKDEGFDLYCPVFNQVVVGHVFSDEMAEEIVNELVDNSLGEGNAPSENDDHQTEAELRTVEKQLSEAVITEEKLLSPVADLS